MSGLGLQFLLVLALVLFLGLLVARLSGSWPAALFLFVLGGLLGHVKGVALSSSVWLGLGVLALSLAVFDAVSRWDWRRGGDWVGYFMGVSVVLVGLVAWGILGHFARSLNSVLLVLLLVFLVIGVEIPPISQGVWRRWAEEGQWLSVFSLVLPFVVLMFWQRPWEAIVVQGVVLPFHPLVQEVVTGVGAGLVVGLVCLRVLRDRFSYHFSPAGLLVAVLVAFVFGEILGGSGVLAVAALAVLFGQGFVKGKQELCEFSRSFGSALSVLVMVLAGIALKIPFSGEWLAKGLILFGGLLVSRILAVEWSGVSRLEKVKVVAFMPKGFYSAAALLGLVVLGPASLLPWLQVAWLVMVLCLLISAGTWKEEGFGSAVERYNL